MELIIILAAGASLFLLSIIIRKLNKLPFFSRKKNKYLRKSILCLELVIWISFIFWVIRALTGDKAWLPYLTGALAIAFTSVLYWFAGKDFIAGFIFRIRHDLSTGSFIATNDLKGQIQSLDMTGIRLKSETGDILLIPYSKMVNSVIIELPANDPSAGQTFTLAINSSLPAEDREQMIRKMLYNNPWVSIKDEPIIETSRGTGGELIFKVTVQTANKKTVSELIKVFENIPEISVNT